MSNHVLVCGLGHVGYRIVQVLHGLGEPVSVLTKKVHDEWIREVEAQGIQVVLGDARDRDLLRRAGLETASALIAATDGDLVNIEIALDAREIRPDLPIVVRLFDQTLARRLESSFGLRRALGMSAIAAPSFASAAMGEHIAGSFRAGGHLYIVGRLHVGPDSALLGLTLDQVAEQHRLATLTYEDGAVPGTSGPRPDQVVAEGAHLTVMGTHQAWERASGEKYADREHRPPFVRWLHFMRHALHPHTWWRFIVQVWQNAPLPLRSVFVALNVLILASVFIFHHFMKLPPIDALYFIITTVTTTGYGDITPVTEKDRLTPQVVDGLKLYACVVMLLGSATIGVLYSIITDFVVTSRFQQILGRQRVPEHGHIVVVGIGNVGYRVVEALMRAGAAVVAIDRQADRDFVESLRTRIPVVIGDARVADTLLKAGVAHARAVIACSNDDAVNLGVGLVTNQINPKVRTVVRLFDADFARKVQASLTIDVAMGASMVAAPMFAASALYNDVCEAFLIDGSMFVIVERPAHDWQGLKPSEVLARHGLRILMRRPTGAAHFSILRDDEPLLEEDRCLAVLQRSLRQS